jgi:hypothetical protein
LYVYTEDQNLSHECNGFEWITSPTIQHWPLTFVAPGLAFVVHVSMVGLGLGPW